MKKNNLILAGELGFGIPLMVFLAAIVIMLGFIMKYSQDIYNYLENPYVAPIGTLPPVSYNTNSPTTAPVSPTPKYSS